MSVNVGSMADVGTVRLRFKGGALSMFGRALVVILGSLFIIPAAWVTVWYVHWFVEQIELSDGSRIRFYGKPGDAWYWFSLIVVIGFLPTIVSSTISDAWYVSILMAIVTAALTAIVGVQLWRWYAANASIGETTDLRFDGEVLPFIGYNVGMQLSAYTIVGWAWVLAAFQRWLMRHVRSNELEFAFVGSGLNILWRIFAMAFGCLFIIPIPWVMRWLLAWFIDQTIIHRKAAPQPAANWAYPARTVPPPPNPAL